MYIETRNKIHVAYFLTFILAACSLLYELVIAQTFAFLTSSTVLWYSLTIGLYLCSMGCGALICEKLYKKRFAWSDLLNVEIVLSFFGSIAVLVINYSHVLYIALTMNNQFRLALVVLFLTFFLIVVMIGILTGLELPLLIKLCNEMSKTKRVTNRVLCADYIGSLAGGLILPLVLMPSFDLLSIGCIVALVNLSVAVFILIYFMKGISKNIVVNTVVFSVLYGLIFYFLIHVEPIKQYFLKKEYFYKYVTKGEGSIFQSFNDFKDIERYRSIYQNIDIAKIPEKYNEESVIGNLLSKKYIADPNYPKGYMLFLDQEFQFHSDKEEFYHEYLAHVPIILNGSVPRKILVLGAGDGFLVRELVKYSEIESITLVELDKKMIDLANDHPLFVNLNKNSFKDPRVEIKILDAYYYMKHCREKYDAIYLDLPVPENYDLSKLYSREFFFFIHRSLNEHGFAAFETAKIRPLFYQSDEKVLESNNVIENYWNIYSSTIKIAGFKTIIPFFSNFNSKRKEIKQIIYDFLDTNAEEWKKKVPRDKKDRTDYQVIQDKVAGQVADKYLAKNLDGFIMMIKGNRKANYQYIDFKIPVYVLNEELFEDAFDFTKRIEDKMNPDNINSIFRPILPRQLFFRLYSD